MQDTLSLVIGWTRNKEIGVLRHGKLYKLRKRKNWRGEEETNRQQMSERIAGVKRRMKEGKRWTSVN